MRSGVARQRHVLPAMRRAIGRPEALAQRHSARAEQRCTASRRAAAISQAEKELWTGSYSPKAMVGWFVGAGLLTIVGIVLILLSGRTFSLVRRLSSLCWSCGVRCYSRCFTSV